MWKMVVMQFEIEYSLRILGPVVRSCKQPEKRVKKLKLLDGDTGNLDQVGILDLHNDSMMLHTQTLHGGNCLHLVHQALSPYSP